MKFPVTKLDSNPNKNSQLVYTHEFELARQNRSGIATNIALKITGKNENTAEDIVVSPRDTNNQNAPVNEIWHNESMKRKHLNANKSDRKK